MRHYTYLIIGGGMTADAAVQGIREMDPHNPIGLIGEEPHIPYDRPPLSKKLWKGKPVDIIWRKKRTGGADLFLERKAVSIDPQGKRVVDNQEEVYTFDKLLLATGGIPRRLPFGNDRIIYFRTLDDYLRLRRLTDGGKRFAVIGGGFIGSEIAAALSMNGKEVVMLFPGPGIADRVLPHDLSDFLNSFFRNKGVEVLTGETVTDLKSKGQQLAVETASGREIVVDGVVAGIGIEPNVGLALQAGLVVQNGIVVDELLRSSHPDIYAAGDVAAFYNPPLGKRIRVEHEDNANTMGRQAGRNMAGAAEPYNHLPSFYSDLFELGYEAVGELDARLETVADWQEPFQKGVVYYLENGRVRGTLLWNVWKQVDAARRLIAEEGPFRPEDLKGLIPS